MTASLTACRFCGCTEVRACIGGCSWAFDDVCTACLGHTPASWEALVAARMEVGDSEVRPPLVCMIAAMAYASKAIDDIAGFVSQQTYSRDPDPLGDAMENLLLAAIEVIEAGGDRPEHMQLLAAIEKQRDEAR